MENCYNILLQYALKLIARKRYTEQELNKKLLAKKIGSKEDQDKVIKRLKELKYIDDNSFAKDYISTRTLINPRGERMLKMELRRKGVDKNVASNAVDKAEINEKELARRIIKKKEKRYQGLDKYKRKEKIMRFLASRGFKLDTIYKVLDGW
jgi:regulatory protein